MKFDREEEMTARKDVFRGLCLICIAVSSLSFSGCMWGRVKVNDPSVADSARSVKPGVTRVSELDDILKVQPTLRMPGKDMTLLGYTYSDTKNNGLMLIAVNFMRSTTVTDTLYIEADPATQIVRKVHIPPKRTLEWRFWPFGD
jgi:hypothetical protein